VFPLSHKFHEANKITKLEGGIMGKILTINIHIMHTKNIKIGKITSGAYLGAYFG